ncbi:3-methyladenine DNA glycosylase [Sulfurovum sp.]|uniref:3-methyladenine DNA glycosylase n=1 Tax=Sulfurovum sp. TaxID=1969726 RepID=UPI0025E92845|nr:3-methyladenine DNA glycosylase [Sulfurovum sp.]
MITSCQIYRKLEAMELLQSSPPRWWPGAGTFEVVVGAVLTQNTTWKNVEKSLLNLEGHLTLENFLSLDEERLKNHIRPSGFYNQKAPRLISLAKQIAHDFHTFEHFQTDVSREWLLSQKGVGPETADSILCYGCFRNEMVVDSYTKRVLRQYGVVLSDYHEYKAFLENGITAHCREDINLIFSRFHGMIVEYSKKMKLKA